MDLSKTIELFQQYQFVICSVYVFESKCAYFKLLWNTTPVLVSISPELGLKAPTDGYHIIELSKHHVHHPVSSYDSIVSSSYSAVRLQHYCNDSQLARLSECFNHVDEFHLTIVENLFLMEWKQTYTNAYTLSTLSEIACCYLTISLENFYKHRLVIQNRLSSYHGQFAIVIENLKPVLPRLVRERQRCKIQLESLTASLKNLEQLSTRTDEQRIKVRSLRVQIVQEQLDLAEQYGNLLLETERYHYLMSELLKFK
jgi:hypothetical protein